MSPNKCTKAGQPLSWRLLAVGLGVIVCAVNGCARKAPPPIGEEVGPPYSVNGKTYYPLLKVDEYVERGTASWYGSDFHGKKTSSGEPYDMYAPTAAHRVLPFGSLVRVKNLTNGRNTMVRINDRGPFVKDRIIDLSYHGARALGMVGPGTAPVEIAVVGIDARYARPLAAVGSPTAVSQAGCFAVQIGAFADPANADGLKKKLSAHFHGVYVVPVQDGESAFYRVRVGTYKTLKETAAVQQKLASKGYRDTVMVAEER